MRRTSMSIAAGLAAAVLLVPTVPAQAAVKAKDARPGRPHPGVPRARRWAVRDRHDQDRRCPGQDLRPDGTAKAKSAYSVSGVSAEGQPVVAAGVGELKSSATTVSYFKAYKKFVKSCASYTDAATGATVTMEMGKAPKLGQEALMITQQIAIAGVTSYTATVLVRHKKRMGSVLVIDDAPISTSGLNKLAKVTAKKMK